MPFPISDKNLTDINRTAIQPAVSGSSASVWGTEIIQEDSGIVLEKTKPVAAPDKEPSPEELHNQNINKLKAKNIDTAPFETEFKALCKDKNYSFAGYSPEIFVDYQDNILKLLSNKNNFEMPPELLKNRDLSKNPDKIETEKVSSELFGEFTVINLTYNEPDGVRTVTLRPHMFDYTEKKETTEHSLEFSYKPIECFARVDDKLTKDSTYMFDNYSNGKIINRSQTTTYADGSVQTSERTFRDKKAVCEVVSFENSAEHLTELHILNKDGTKTSYALPSRKNLSENSYEETCDGKTYTVTRKDGVFTVKEQGSEDIQIIDADEFVNPDNPDSSERLFYIMYDLPVQVLKDLDTECVSLSYIGDVDGIDKNTAGEYSGDDDSIVSGSNYLTLIHETGHALDFRPIEYNDSSAASDKKYMKVFNEELKQYKKKGNKIYSGQGDYDTYCTKNEVEMFAECYTLLSNGKCNSKAVIAAYFPRTLAEAKRIIDFNRSLPDEERR